MKNRLFNLLLEALSPEAKKLLFYKRNTKRLKGRESELMKDPINNRKELAVLASRKSGNKKGHTSAYMDLGRELVRKGSRTREDKKNKKGETTSVKYVKVKKSN